ncbi:MAG: M56 family metallopeptidase, partial [Cyclobacteriaceae bacterium]
MSDYLIYLFEANCALLLLGFFYYAFLKSENDFRRKRLYLLGSTLFALILPLLHLDFFQDQGETIKGIQTMVLPEIVIGGGEINEAETVKESFSWVGMAYWSGVVILFLWLMFQIGQVIWFFSANSGRIIRQDGHIIIRTNGTLPTFSFFNLLFFDDSIELTPEEEKQVITHELAHIRQYHSMDILFLEAVKILFWFNPVSWYNRKEIQELHEFLADDVLLREIDAEEYSDLLARM